MHIGVAQRDVMEWVKRCFGDQANDPGVRALRLAEEAIEFAQAVGVDRVKLQQLITYVYDRPAGNPAQELGGVGNVRTKRRLVCDYVQ
jgi:hypothetical protein